MIPRRKATRRCIVQRYSVVRIACGRSQSVRAATHVDKIPKGAKPADLPMEQPTKSDLVVNLKTARTLGLTIPPSILIQATEIIQ